MSVMASTPATVWLHHPIPFTPYLQAQKEATVSMQIFWGQQFLWFSWLTCYLWNFDPQNFIGKIWCAAFGEPDTQKQRYVFNTCKWWWQVSILPPANLVWLFGFHVTWLKVSCIKFTSSDVQWFQSRSLCLMPVSCGQPTTECYCFQYKQITPCDNSSVTWNPWNFWLAGNQSSRMQS